MENIQYTIGNKYIVISQNRIQSRQYKVNKIIIGELLKDTGKSLVFMANGGVKRRVSKRTISELTDISRVDIVQTQLFINKIEDALV